MVQVAAGQYHSLAVDSSGRVLSWGWGLHGQCGVGGGVEDCPAPRPVPRLPPAVRVAAGYAHSLALTQTGVGPALSCPVTLYCALQAVYAWGGSSFGQCGTGKTAKVSRPTRVELAGPARLLGAGYFTSIAVVGETVLVWGANPQVGIRKSPSKLNFWSGVTVGSSAEEEGATTSNPS